MKVFLASVLLAVTASSATAQEAVALQGRLLNSLSAAPIAGATVVLEESRRETVSDADGLFQFDGVMPGRYHVSVRTTGYSSRRTEVTVPAPAAMPIDVFVDPDLHFQEVASVSADARSQFDAFQPTTVLAGQELTKQLESSLGATLENQPGVSVRSFGPAPSRPVIRGLDGDRVQILQDGQRPGDLSSQSGDHGVSINPSAAESIEVVRGPATLLYGANAIGGLVNVITNDIPAKSIKGSSGNFSGDLGTNAKEAGGAGHVLFGNGRFAMSVGGGGRRSEDFETPEGAVANSHSRSGFATIGAAWTGEKVHVGGNYGYDDSKYGIPVVEGGTLQLTPKRHALTFRAGGEKLEGAFDAFRATLAHRSYKHQELEGEESGTLFTNETTELQLMGSHRAVGRLKGSVGGSVVGRAFNAVGAEALSPAVDQRGFAAFLYEEVTWPHVTLQFGGRADHTKYTPVGEPAREFTNASVSGGILLRPAAANDRLTIAASVAQAARPPALEELFFFGVHHGNFALEVGNPNLKSERALGADLSLRWRTPRASGELTYFRNDIRDYIFRRQIDREEFEAREDEFVALFGGREPSGHADHEGEEEEEHSAEEEIAFVEFVGADVLLQGIEAHSDFQITSQWSAELGLDFVRGALKDEKTPLPRIPPLKVRGGLRYQRNALQVGGQIIAAAKQDRVSGVETPTEGYTVLRLYGSYSFQTGGVVSTFTLRLDNAANELYRNHLSLIKDVVPEMGRNWKVVYGVRF
ncbi:MAG TPA: TonB-dependent receptor [Vicinamibacterales bacterium]|nr:TonB-dependent receptor [Vicinamibacterales bacterium]